MTERFNPRAVYSPGLGSRRQWLAEVDGEPLLGRSGQVRRFLTEEAAQEAADLNAFLRDDTQ